MKRNRTTVRFIARGAAIASIYVCLTLVSAVLGLSAGVIQVRLSEALCLLPLIMPEAIAGLTIGCAIANFVTGCALWDIIFGSLATLMASFLTRLLKNYFTKKLFLAPLPTILSNSIIIPFILMFVYSANGTYPLFFASIFVGEFLSAGLLGLFLYKRLKNSSAIKNLLY